MPWRIRWSIFLAIALTALSACGGEAAPLERSEWFQQTHMNTHTPHGRIKPGSVREDEDTVIYETESGHAFRQAYRPDGAGGYERVGDPEMLSE